MPTVSNFPVHKPLVLPLHNMLVLDAGQGWSIPALIRCHSITMIEQVGLIMVTTFIFTSCCVQGDQALDVLGEEAGALGRRVYFYE